MNTEQPGAGPHLDDPQHNDPQHGGPQPDRPQQNPAIVVVEDEPEARERLERLLHKRFGGDYQVISESSGQAAISRVAELRALDIEVPIILADQSLPGMTGVECLAACAEICPESKRCVLVEWGELEKQREPILRGAALGQLETFVAKPWRDADEAFYHNVQKFLDEWDRTHRPQYEMVRIVGSSNDAYVHMMRDALYRSGVPFGFYEATGEEGRLLLAEVGMSEPLPVVIFSDGTPLGRPSPREIASALGVNSEPGEEEFDVTIVGAGPAGLAAAVYGASEGLSVMLVETEALGGQASTSTMIRNYLGFPRGLSGAELAGRAFRQAWFFGAGFLIGRSVSALRAEGASRVVVLDDESEVRSRTVVLANGVSYRRLGIERLEALVGQGVYYGAPVTEAPGMVGKQVYVVGGGNSSGQAVLHLARYAEKVTLLVRDPRLKEMSDYLIHEMAARRNVEVRLNTVVTDVLGENHLEGLVLRDMLDGRTEQVAAAAVFILIGAEPRTTWLPDSIRREERGYVLTGDALGIVFMDGRRPAPLETSMPGVYAAGDVRDGSMKRIAAAVGEGSTVIRMVHDYLALSAGDGSAAASEGSAAQGAAEAAGAPQPAAVSSAGQPPVRPVPAERRGSRATRHR